MSALFDCPVCGTWRCAECGWTRTRASRFSDAPQDCHRCGSRLGEMKPVQHVRKGLAEDHLAAYEARVAEQGRPRYPLERAPDPVDRSRDWLVSILARVNGLEIRNDLPHRRASIESIYRKEMDAIIASGWESQETTLLRERMADLLTRTANALKGEPVDGNGVRFMHDWSDLPQVAAQVADRARLAQTGDDDSIETEIGRRMIENAAKVAGEEE